MVTLNISIFASVLQIHRKHAWELSADSVSFFVTFIPTFRDFSPIFNFPNCSLDYFFHFPPFFPRIFSYLFPSFFSYHLTLHYFHFYPVFFFPDFSLSSLLRQFYGDFPRLCPNSFFPLWSTPIWGSLSLQRAPWNDNWVFPCTCVKPCLFLIR